jgi:diguanylate cyclase (GGDEF)-like protein/PAS domain S-box-containing protein
MNLGVNDVALAAGLALACLLLALTLWRLRTIKRSYRRLFDNLPQSAVMVFDRDLRVKVAAGPALAQFGLLDGKVEGRPLRDLIPQAQGDALSSHFAAALRGEKRSFEYHSLRSGRDYWMRIVPLPAKDGTIDRGMSVALDITDRKRSDPEIASRAADVDAVTEATRSLARSVDPTTARRAVCEGAAEVAEAPVAALFEPGIGGASLVAKASVGADLAGMELALEGESGAALAFGRAEEIFINFDHSAAESDREFMRRARARAVLWHPVIRDRAAIGVLAIAWREETAGVSLRLSAMIDLLGAEAAVAIGRADLLGQLEHLARTDSLTGLPNRRHWEQQLPRELARSWRDEQPICVAMLDLDHFKQYNDRRGHQAGDRLLRDASRAWRDALRPYDILARYGGEEFSVILPNCAIDDAFALVERLRSETPDGESCSAGIAEWDSHEQPEALVGRADAALYRAKRAGRNRAVTAVAAE